MAAAEELQILLKLLGAKDTEAALRAIATGQKQLAEEAKKAAADAKRQADDWAHLAKAYDEAEAAQSSFRATVVALKDELSGAGVAERVQAISAALREMSGGAAGLSAPSFAALAAELQELEGAGARLGPELQQIVDAERHLAQLGAESAQAQAQLADAAARADAALAAETARVADLVDELSGGRVAQEISDISKAVDALGGGSQIAGPQLQALGERLRVLEAAGNKLPPNLQAIARETAVTAQAQQAMSDAAQGMAQQLGPAGALLSAMGPAGLAAAAGIGATVGMALLAASALREWTQGLLDTAGALTDQRDETGLSLKTLQEYGFVAAAAGVSQDALVSGVQRLSRTLAEGGDEAASATKRLGLSFAELRALSPDQQFMAIKTALDGVASASQKAALIKDFGLKDPAMLRVLAQDVTGLRQEFDALGLAIDTSTAERFDAMGDELAKLDLAISAFKSSIVQMVFGSADASAAIADLTKLVAEAGSAAREAAPLFADLYRMITGSSISEQIQQLREFIALSRGVAQFIASGGKEFGVKLPQAPKPQGQKPLSNVGSKPGATDAEARAAEERFKRLKELMDQLSGAAQRQALNDLALTVAKLGGLGGVAAGEYQKLKEQVRALGESAPVPDILKPLLDTAEDFGPTLEELGINFDVLSTRDLSGLVGQVKASTAAAGGLVAATREEILAARDAERAEQGRAAAVEFTAQQMLAAGELTQAEYDKIVGKTEEAKEATIDWSGVLADVRNAFEVLGISADSVFGKILGGFSSALAAAERFKAAQKQGGFGGAVGMGLAGLQAAGTAFQSGSLFGGAASGAAFGASVGGPLGAAIGGVAGGILGLFGGKAKVKKELAELRAQLLSSVGGSMEELRKRAASLGVDISRAFTTKNPKELKAIIDQLNKAAEEQKKRWEGVQTALAGLTQRVKGFTAELEGSTEATMRQQQSFERLGLFAVATFAAYVRESGDVIGALREIEDSLAGLADAQATFGFEGSAAFEQLLQLRGVVQANSEVADSIQGLNQLMQGLGDAGLNSKELFDAFGQDAVELFTQLTAGGATANQAMALMQPTLQKLWEHQKKYGDITDESTLALLQQAEAQGLVGEAMQSVNQQILDVLIAIGDVLGAQIPEGLRRMGDTAEREFGRFANAANNANNNMPGNFPGGGPPEGNGGEGFAIGGTVHAPLSGAQVTVHGTEHIMRPEQFQAMVNAAVQEGYRAAVAQMDGMGRESGETIVVLDGERVGRTMRRRAETNRDTPRRGPMAPRRRF